MTKIEDDPKCKTTKMEENQNGIRLKMEDNCQDGLRLPQLKMLSWIKNNHEIK